MSLLDRLFGRTKPQDPVPEASVYTSVHVTETKIQKPRKPRAKKTEPAPEPAIERTAPKVAVTNLDFDPQNPRLGSLELDWNEEFIMLLQQHGYTGATPEEMVDAWLNDICRNILSNQFPGAKVTNIDTARFVNRQDIGGGKTEVS